MHPSFFIVGTQKGGTTSLYNYLVQHPCVLSADEKEIHFFSDNFHKGSQWYQEKFPHRIRKLLYFPWCRENVITGEATPFYMFHPLAPTRIKQWYPDAKIIMLLRNPVDRAYSHYQYHYKLEAEEMSFEEAIAAEPQRLKGEVEKMIKDESYNSTNYKLYSYLTRGLYAEQIKRWLGFFPREQILVLKSEDFFSNPQECFATVQQFLGLKNYSLSSYKKFNAGKSQAINSETREQLVRFFAPHNEELYELVGTDFGWD